MNSKTVNGVKCFLYLVGLLGLVVSAQGASFDCAKAGTKVEKMICGNSDVSRLDENVDLAYLRALERADDRQKVVQGQRDWLKNVRNACADADCLFMAYANREDALNDIPTHKCYWLEPPIKDGSGKRPPVEPICHVMEENLNQFCNLPPMACGLKIAPKFSKQFTLPTWTPLDPIANRALIEEFLRAPYEGSRKANADAVWAEEQPLLEAAFAKKRITFAQSQTKLDLYNLSKTETVYRLDYGNCHADNPQLNNPAQWNKGLNPPIIRTQYAPDVVRPLYKQYFPMSKYMNEVFLYEDKVYDFIMGGPEDPARGNNQMVVNQYVQKIYKADTRPTLLMNNVCIFNYQPVRKELK